MASRLQRCWRGDRPFTARAMVDRVRWQLEGWLQGPVITAPTAGVTMLRLTVGEAVPDDGRQMDFEGGLAEASRQVERGLARVQGLLGHEAVLTAVPDGRERPGRTDPPRGLGRGARGRPRAGGARRSQARPVRAGERASAPGPPGRSCRQSVETPPPWPGRLPPPSPALVHHGARSRRGPRSRRGSSRGDRARAMHGAPFPLDAAITDAYSVVIMGWAGPWPADERWWDPAAARRRARLQVLLEDGTAHLLVLERGSGTSKPPTIEFRFCRRGDLPQTQTLSGFTASVEGGLSSQAAVIWVSIFEPPRRAGSRGGIRP